MPAVRREPGAVACSEPYPLDIVNPIVVAESGPDKENTAPSTAAAPAKAKRATKSSSSGKKSPDRSHLPASYLDIELEEKKGEVPVYETASNIRMKLNKLATSKTTIPGSTKKWSKAAIAAEMNKIAQNHHPVKDYHGKMTTAGPSANALSRFLNKSGRKMAGGDADSYYYGNMLLEKLRIWNCEKKTAAQMKAEQEFPNGRVRCDPEHMYLTMLPGESFTYNELADQTR